MIKKEIGGNDIFMQQIENYISRLLQEKCISIESVLIIVNDYNGIKYEYLTRKLIKHFNIKKVYSINTVPNKVDMIIFDIGCQEIAKIYSDRNPAYVIGKMAVTEDYFGFWEQNRNICQGIYIEKENDIGKPEILEWYREETDIELSIIIPVYNIAMYIDKCIDTLTQWKASYVEYIFVDDGSTDNSPELIRRRMQVDTRIKLIQKVNGGCASARNKGIQSAKGRYIGIVDGDDFINETMYIELLKRALLGNYDLTYCGFAEYYEDSGNLKIAENDYMGEPYLTGTYRQDKVQLLVVNTRVAIWRCLYKKSIIQESGITFHEDLKRFDDLPFKVEYIFASKSAVCVPKILYYYRLGRQGQDTSYRDKRLYIHFEIFRYLNEYVKKKNDQRMWDLLQIVKLNTHKYAISIIRSDLKKDYIKKACRELKDSIKYWRCIWLVWLYMGWKNAFWLTMLWIRN